jgi:hypothetical protein
MMMARNAISLLVMTAASWAGTVLANGEAGHEEPETTIFKFIIIPFGVATLFSILTTVTLGLKMARNRAVIFPWHRRMALTTTLLALCHATLVIIFH